VNKKWVYPTLLTFLVFFVLSNPETAGPQTRSFFGWVGTQASAIGTFLDGVFDDTPNNTTTTPAQPGTTSSTAPPGGTPTDSFNTMQLLHPTLPPLT
jgi:hypothetical protein